MKQINKYCLEILFLLFANFAFAENSYDISEFYSIYEPANGTIAVGSFSITENIEYILTPTKLDTCKCAVEVENR